MELKELKNYNAIMSIISCFNHSAIFRLKKTFQNISFKDAQNIIELDQLVSPDFNYKKHRELINFITTPCIPYFGMFLTGK
jgi:hypothetical protein